MRKNILIASIIIASVLLIGCTKNADNNELKEVQQTVMEQEEVFSGEYGDVSDDFYFIIEDVFSLIEQNSVVVVGINRNSPMYSGMDVEVVTMDGIKKTTIGGIEVYEQGIVDGVPEECNVGVLLTGLTADDIQAGDIIVLPGKVEISDEEVGSP